ncbi:MAG: oligosaccharide flippase family protein, partial [Acidobacteria bacterium]|nr:oligosaccharide flippase family protein [Acidobacteriota bacterium]
MFTFRLLRNIFSNYARLAISGLIGFLLTPILFHSLQPENYAILVFGLGTVVALQGLELGLYATVERFVSDLAARGQHAELRRLVSSAFYLQAGLGVLGAIALLLLSSFLARFFHVEGTAAASGRVVLIWLGLSLVFQLPGNTLRAFLEGCQDFHLANAVDVLVQLLRASFIIVLLWKGFGLGTIAVVFPAAALAQLVAMLFSLRWATLRFWPNPADVDLNSLRSVSRFAGLTFVSENAGWYFSQLDIFLAARLLPLPNLAILAVARRFPWALTQLCLQPLHAAYPLLPAAEARGERSLTQKFFYLATRNLLALALPIAVALFAWSELI